MINVLFGLFGKAGDACNFSSSSFLGFPHWYQFLKGVQVATDTTDSSSPLVCNPQLTHLADVWLILAAVLEILLRVAALVAVAFIIYGGITYITSQGNPEDTAKGRNTILSALIGLVIAVIAAAVVAFIAGRF